MVMAEREALKNQQQRDAIIVTKTEKGGAVVIKDTENYVKEANRQ